MKRKGWIMLQSDTLLQDLPVRWIIILWSLNDTSFNCLQESTLTPASESKCHVLVLTLQNTVWKHKHTQGFFD